MGGIIALANGARCTATTTSARMPRIPTRLAISPPPAGFVVAAPLPGPVPDVAELGVGVEVTVTLPVVPSVTAARRVTPVR